jgi:tetratricopeptide (TPR) repeat protein/O-antigen ligase
MKVIRDILRWIVIGSVFLLPIVPFIVANSLFFPYITGKNFTFRFIVELMGGAWLALMLVWPAYRPRRSLVLAAYAFFVIVIGIADLHGAYPFKSIWSNFERMEGWVTLAHLLLYVLAATAVLTTENIWRRLFQVSLFASILLAIHGFMQFFCLVALDQGGTCGLGSRIDSTFGNPIYLAAYLLFHIFLAALLWTQMHRVRSVGTRFWPAFFYASVITIDTIALFLTGTRGTMLGLLGGAFLTLILLSIAPGERRLRRITAGAFVVLCLAGGTLFLARDTAFVNKVGFLGRLASISLSDSTTKARLINMSIAWQGVKERPLLGWGQENFALVFDKYYDPRMYAQEQWFDRVHDSIFDWWIAGGTLGLLAFLSVFALMLWILWRPFFGWSGEDAFTHVEKSILTGLLAGYFFHNLTVFDNLTSSILFVTLLGYVIFREINATKAAPIVEMTIMPEAAAWFVAPAAMLLAFASMFSINGSALAANKALIAALQGQPGGVQQNLNLFKQALSYNSFGTQEIREQLAQVTPQLLASNQVANNLKQQFVDLTVSELDKQSAASPLDARAPLFAGGVLDSAGLYKQAAEYYAKGLANSPKKQSILYQLGQNALAQGDTKQAVQYFADAYKLDTENVSAQIYYASVLIRVGQDSEADAVLQPLIATGQAAAPSIATAYASRGLYSKMIPIWQASVKVNPHVLTNVYTLAGAYYGLGDRASALSVLEQGRKDNPSAGAQIDEFEQQIKDGTLKLQ